MRWTLMRRDLRNSIWEWLESDEYRIWKHLPTGSGRVVYALERKDQHGCWQTLAGYETSAEAKRAAEADLEARLHPNRGHSHGQAHEQAA